jgi:hypothetical protein
VAHRVDPRSPRRVAWNVQTAGDADNSDAKEWVLDLNAIALAIQQEQLQMQTRAVHAAGW